MSVTHSLLFLVARVYWAGVVADLNATMEPQRRAELHCAMRETTLHNNLRRTLARPEGFCNAVKRPTCRAWRISVGIRAWVSARARPRIVFSGRWSAAIATLGHLGFRTLCHVPTGLKLRFGPSSIMTTSACRGSPTTSKHSHLTRSHRCSCSIVP